MALAINMIDGHGPNNEMPHQLQVKKTAVNKFCYQCKTCITIIMFFSDESLVT